MNTDEDTLISVPDVGRVHVLQLPSSGGLPARILVNVWQKRGGVGIDSGFTVLPASAAEIGAALIAAAKAAGWVDPRGASDG
jgi:hypothetical protein